MDIGLKKLLWLVLWVLGQLKSCASMQANSANCSHMHGMVRLVNGTNMYEGRVEVCLHGIWKTVCDDYWDNRNARVVCTQLGYQGDDARSFGRAHFGQGSGLILEEIICFGHEVSLTACHYHDENDGYCRHVEDAGVQCLPCPTNGAIRLQDKTDFQYDSNNIQSLVEICINGAWSAVCDTDFGWIRNPVATSIVCKQLGFSKYGSRPLILHHRLVDFREHLANFHCMGNEQRLIDCSYDYIRSCPHGIFYWGAAAVECQTTLLCQEGGLRLVDGSTDGDGRVEICLNETWGTVCSSNWDQIDSTVACKQLGYSDKGVQVVVELLTGNRPTHLNNVQCIGNESNLYDCHYEVFISTANCTHDVGISCSFDTLPQPQTLQATIDESNNCTLSWQAPNIMMKRYGTIFYYLINCTVRRDEDTDDCNNYTTIAYTNDTEQTLELLHYGLYTCCISGINEVGAGNPACQSFITYESAPATPPTNIEVHPFNATTAFLSWRPPLTEDCNGILREYNVEIVELNTTRMFMYTIQDPYVLIDNLDPDKVYMCRIAAITTSKGPYSEMITIKLNDYSDFDSEQSSVDKWTFTEVVLATSITSGTLLLFLFLSIIVLVIVCARSKVCGSSNENTISRCAVESPVYEMIDITETNLGKRKTATVAVTATQEQHSLPPTSPPHPHPSGLVHTDTFKLDINHGHQEEHSTEGAYQSLLPLRAHQKSISTEYYQSLRQLSKEKPCDLPPPVPPKPKCH